MKTVAAILVAMVVSATATYFVTGTSSKVETQQKVEAETEDKDKAIAALRKALGEATAKANKSEVILVEGAKVSLQGVVTDPADLIDKLANDALTGEDTDSQRRVIHYFESLVDAGNDAVPAIDAFLDQHQDKEFGRQSIRQKLQITGSQIEEMKALEEKTRDQVREKMGAIWRDENMSREEKGEKMRAFFEEMRGQYTALMTEEQKAQLEAMGEDGGRAIRSLIGGGGGRPGGGRGGRPGGR
jgi:hypothetical protein